MRSLCLRPRLKGLICLLIGLSAVCSAGADTLVLSDSQLFGKVVSVGRTDVVFAPACGQQTASYPKSNVLHIEMNSACLPRPISPYSAGGELCPDPPLSLFEVKFKDGKSLAASDFAYQGGRVHIRSASGLQTYHGPAAKLSAVTRRLYCRAHIPADPPMPGFCMEATQFAANFGPEPVFGNRILTRGLSFYLEDDTGRPIPVGDPTGKVIRDGFGTAMTVWISGLQQQSSHLPSQVQAALNPMISHSSGGYTMLIPPQVVQAGCPDAASFVIRYLSHDERGMLIGGQPKAARAEVEGRTLWINGVRYPCWRASATDALYLNAAGAPVHDGTCVNLVPIFVHELGHAFGLVGHRDLPGKRSIMDSVIDPTLLQPTPDDVNDLIQVLIAPVQGAVAGRLDADGLGVEIAPRY